MDKKHLSLLLILLAASTASADVIGTWTDTTGNWNVDTNWSSNPNIPGVPGSEYDTAMFGPVTAGNYTITLQNGSGVGTSVNLSELIFNSDVNEYTISQKTSATKINMKGSYSPSVGSLIEVNQGSHTIDAPLVIGFPTTILMGAASASTLTFTANGNVTYATDYGLTVNSSDVSTIDNYGAMNPYSLSMTNTNFNNDNSTHSGAYNAGATVTLEGSFVYQATGADTATFNNYYIVTANTIQFGNSGTTIVNNDYSYFNSMTDTFYYSQINASGSVSIGSSGTTAFYNSQNSNEINTNGVGIAFTVGDSGTTNVYNNGASSLLYLTGASSYLIIGGSSGMTNVENNGSSSSVYTTGDMSLIYIGSGNGTTSLANNGDSSSVATNNDRADIIIGSGSGTTTIINSGDTSKIYTEGTYSPIFLGIGTGITQVTNSGEASAILTDNIFSDITIGSGSGTCTFINSGTNSYVLTNDPTSSIIIGSGSGSTTWTNSGQNSSIDAGNNLWIGSAFGTTVLNNEGCDAGVAANGTIYIGAEGNGSTTVNNQNNPSFSCSGMGDLATILANGNICVGGVNTVLNNIGQVGTNALGSLIVNDGLINNESGANLFSEDGVAIVMNGGQIFNDASSNLGSSTLNYTNIAGLIEDNANSNQSGSFNAYNYIQLSEGSLQFGIYNQQNYGALYAFNQVSLDGTLIVQTLPGDFFQADDYLTLVFAEGSVSGTFSQVLFEGFPRHLIANITYGADTVNLDFAHVLGPLSSFPSGGVTTMAFLAANQNNLQLLRKMNQLRDRMAPASSNQSGNLTASCDEIVFHIGGVTEARKPETGASQASAANLAKGTRLERQSPFRLYAGPTFSVGNVDNQGRQIGFDYDSAGFFGGFDYALDRFGFGLSIDYTSLSADVHKHWGHFDLNQVVGSFYTVYSPASCQELSVNGIIGAGYDWYDFNRVAGPSFATQKAKGSTTGYVFDALIDVEYTVTQDTWSAMPKDGRLIPLVDLQYIHLNKSQYLEHNASVYNLTVEKECLNSLRTALGARFDYTWRGKNWTFRPQADLAWQYEYMNQNRTVAFNALSALSDSGVGFVPIVAGRSTLLFGVDLLATVYNFVEIEATYDLEYNKLFLDNSFYLGLGVSF